MLNDRDKVNKPQSQIGFIEFMLVPLIESVVQILPPLDGLAKNLGENIHNWMEQWIEEACPEQEQKNKVMVRVEKVGHRCKCLMRDLTTEQRRSMTKQ